MGNGNNFNDNFNASEVTPEQDVQQAQAEAESVQQQLPNAENIDEPTVTFDAVKDQKDASSTGLKVFFALLAVAVMLVAAVSVGYIFGISSSENAGLKNSNTSFHSKAEAEMVDGITVYNNLAPSIVSITVYNEKSGTGSTASGVVYSSDGYIVTNDHIYASVKSPKFIVTFANGSEYEAKFVAGDKRSDLAVLKIEAKNLKPVLFGDYSELVTGEHVIAMGYPSGAGLEPIFTSGTISAKGIRVTGTSTYSVKMIQTDTAINPGNSGGALINMYSQVIGITSAKLAGSEYDSVGYAIPSSTVVTVVDSLIKNGYVSDRGKLGITYMAIDSVQSKLKNIPTGLLIDSVSTDSDLYNRIKKGDVITHINDVVITRSETALDIIDSTAPGVSMTFTVYHPSTGTSEKIIGSLIADQGSASYVDEVTR